MNNTPKPTKIIDIGRRRRVAKIIDITARRREALDLVKLIDAHGGKLVPFRGTARASPRFGLKL